MIKSTKNNDMKSYAEKLKAYTYYSYISLTVWILSGVILAVLLITDITLPIISLMVLLVGMTSIVMDCPHLNIQARFMIDEEANNELLQKYKDICEI